jgi:hypothetical protein
MKKSVEPRLLVVEARGIPGEIVKSLLRAMALEIGRCVRASLIPLPQRPWLRPKKGRGAW